MCSNNNNCLNRGTYYGIGAIYRNGFNGATMTEDKHICKEYSRTYYCPSGGTLGSTHCTKIDTEYKLFSSF